MEKPVCAFCDKPILNGHIVAKIDWRKYVFCYRKRLLGEELCLDKFLTKHPVRFSFTIEERVI